MPRYYFIAGEASGDLHAAKVIEELKRLQPEAQIRAWGGDEMKKAGAVLDKHINELALMGFVEVVANIRKIFRNFSQCKKNITGFAPDAVILTDFAGFNLRIAKFAKENGFPVYYYIAPKVWAWNKSRIKKLKAYTDRVFLIFPFEETFFAPYHLNAVYVGNPLVERIDAFRPDKDFLTTNGLPEGYTALLPGSRRQEIKYLFPPMLEYARQNPGRTFVVAASPEVHTLFGNYRIPENVKTIYGNTYNVLYHAGDAIVKSGTATLETALFNTPQVVVYKGGTLSYTIARAVVDKTFLKHISLVNIIAGKEIVKELLQKDYTLKNLTKEMQALQNQERREMILNEYRHLRTLLGDKSASKEVAKTITEDIRNTAGKRNNYKKT